MFRTFSSNTATMVPLPNFYPSWININLSTFTHNPAAGPFFGGHNKKPAKIFAANKLPHGLFGLRSIEVPLWPNLQA